MPRCPAWPGGSLSRSLALFLLLAPTCARRALLVIDMTVGQWSGISYRANSTLATVSRLVANKSEPHFDLIIDTHLAMGCTSPEQGTICEIEWPRGPAATALLPSLSYRHVTFVAKESYSSFVGSTLDATLRAAGVDTLFITVINTDYCVFATALSAWERAYHVSVVVDGVTSVGGATGHAEGLKMLHKFFVDFSDTKRVQLVESGDIPMRHPDVAARHAAATTAQPEAWALDGSPLFPSEFSGLTAEALDAQLSIARANLQTPPRDDPA